MKPLLKTTLVAIVALAIGGVGGYLYSSYSISHAYDETIHAVILSHDALNATQFTMLLNGIRDGKQDLVADRIESHLDFALIGLSREYSPSRDAYGTAAKALALARKYRTEHPRTSSLDSVKRQVQDALSIMTDQSPNP